MCRAVNNGGDGEKEGGRRGGKGGCGGAVERCRNEGRKEKLCDQGEEKNKMQGACAAGEKSV